MIQATEPEWKPEEHAEAESSGNNWYEEAVQVQAKESQDGKDSWSIGADCLTR